MGLQHVALDRTPTTNNMDDHMRRTSCIQDARRLSERSHGFRDSLKASVQPFLSLLQQRFSRLKLKWQPIEVAMAASDEDVTDFFQSFRIIDEALEHPERHEKM